MGPELSPTGVPPRRPIQPRPRPSIDGFSYVARPMSRPQQPAARPVFDRPPMSQEWTPPAPVAEPAPEPEPWTPPQVPAPETPPTPVSEPAPQPEPKPRRRPSGKLIRRAVIVLVILALLAAGGWLWQQHRNAGTPQSVLRATLLNMLATNSLQTERHTGTDQVTTQFDFSTTTNPTVSTKSTVGFYGSNFGLSGYGSIQSDYFKYTSLPNSVPADEQANITRDWVQWRDRSTATAGVTSLLQQLSDPRYQIIGPAIFGNFSPDAAQKLVDYMLAKNVYKFSVGSVKSSQIDGQKVWLYPVTLNLAYLKIANQSAASSMAIAPGDVQTAVDALDQYKGQSATLAINPRTHQLVRFAAGQTTIDYSGYGATQLPNEPVTNLTWAKFQAVQLQIEAEAASRESAAQLDAHRKNDFAQLQRAFATYFQQNGFYPLQVNLNNQPWMVTNLPGLDLDSLHEPLSHDVLVTAAPGAGHYSYQATDAAGSPACNNTLNDPCVHYHLTAILTNGQAYTVSDLTNAP